MDGLLGNTQLGRNLSPRPPKVTSSVDLERLQLFGESPKRRDRP